MATVTADLTTGFRVELRNDRHVWHADEPVADGGSDTAPTPYEQLLGAVGACTCITVSLYAQRKGIALTSISAQFHYEKVHADDCADCGDGREGWLDHVRAEIFLEGTFTDDQRKRLVEVAQRCPVRRTLENGIVFTERVVAG